MEECFERWHKYPQDLFGIAEFAEVLGLSKRAFDGRLRRGKIIAPSVWLAMGPVWTRERVRAHLLTL